MDNPKLHHYVPQFYLKRFTDQNGRFWVYNKNTHNVFQTSPGGVAAESHFYRVPELVGTEHSPLFLERQFASIESDIAEIMGRWLSKLSIIKQGDNLEIPIEERQLVSFYIALQFLRTAEQRDILSSFVKENGSYAGRLSADERANLHARILCEEGLVDDIAERINNSIWIFGRNITGLPFFTSDNPVIFKTPDNRMWLKAYVFSEGTYAVFPLSPSTILYCKERTYWKKIAKRIDEFANCLSPVEFTTDMVEHENTGQIFAASRFIISPKNDFNNVRRFIESIGTDMYAPHEDK